MSGCALNLKSCPDICPLPDGGLYYWPSYLATEKAAALLDSLREELAWEQSVIQVYGRAHRIPRLNAWYGDPDARYRYSGRQFMPQPWTDSLRALRDQLNNDLDARFNSVLANCYRDGQDTMGYHADDEPELGEAPAIACISLGAERALRFRHKARQVPSFNYTLHAGSLLVMAPGMQSHWQHGLPRRVSTGVRISLTFRQIVTPTDHIG